MPRNKSQAVVALYMSPQLKRGLQEAALLAGCSLNAYCTQVLAAAGGQHSRFRAVADGEETPEERRSELRELERKPNGFPCDYKQHWRHGDAREPWVEKAMVEMKDWPQVMRWIDHNMPWHYVEWKEFNAPYLPEGLEREHPRAVG
jgi:hypothetical protein